VKPSVEGEGDTKMSSLFMTWVRSEAYFVPKEFGPLQFFWLSFALSTCLLSGFIHQNKFSLMMSKFWRFYFKIGERCHWLS